MRRFLSTSFIALALVVSAAGAAHAAAGDPCDADGNPGTLNASGLCVPNGATAVPSGTSASAAAVTTPTVDTATAADTKIPTTPKLAGDTAAQFGTIMTWIMSLFSWLVGVAALTLNYAVYYTVITMGDYVHKLSAIGVTWRIMRDIGNIFLIFGFLAAGISTILNVDMYGFGKKMLPKLLVAAVFLNFSLFITEAIIDTGNLFATQFMTQINGGVPMTLSSSGLLTTASGATLTASNEGISNKIMAQLGFQTIFNPNQAAYKAGNTWLIGFMGIILFLITAFVMFSLAFILIARFVILIFLIILAPIGFAGLAVPRLAGTAKKWWDALFDQTLTAPVLLLLLYVALAVITDAQFLTGICGSTTCTKNWLGFVQGNNLTGFASLLISFFVAMGLLIAVVIVAKKMSAAGAAGATALAGKLTFGLTAAGMRSTVGWGSQGAAQAIRRTRFGASKYGRAVVGTLDRGAKASFDVRGATAFGGLKGIGIEAGDAQKGGYKARRENAIKEQQAYAKSLVEAHDEKGFTPKEEEAIASAEAAQETAKAAFNDAEKEFNATKARIDSQITTRDAEIAQLKLKIAEEEASSYNGAATPETEAKLKTAQQQLTVNKGELGVATTKYAAVAKTSEEAEKAAKTVTKEAGDRLGGAKRKAQLDYADSISGSFLNWAAFGPGGAAAARKIKTEAKKSPDKLLLDSLKKAIAAGDKEAKPAASEPTAPKPATP